MQRTLSCPHGVFVDADNSGDAYADAELLQVAYKYYQESVRAVCVGTT